MRIDTVYILPHPPELFSFLSDLKEASLSKKTFEAYDCLIDEIAAEEPESIVFVQSLGGIFPEGITLHIPPDRLYDADYLSFFSPDSGPKLPGSFQIRTDDLLASQIQKSLHEFEMKTNVLDEATLPLGVLIFLDLYKKNHRLPGKIVTLGVSLEGSVKHYQYGSNIGRSLSSDSENTVVVCIGQLAHTISKDSRAGYVPVAKDYDMDVQNFLRGGHLDKFALIDPFVLDEVGEDLYRPLSLSMGILNARDHGFAWDQYSYEAPLGIGYLAGKLQSKK